MQNMVHAQAPGDFHALNWGKRRMPPEPGGIRDVLSGRLRRQQLAGADVDRRVPELRHGPGLDLADALTGELEALADLLEGPRLAPVEAEAQAQDLALAVVERLEQPVDLLGQQGLSGGVERRHGRR